MNYLSGALRYVAGGETNARDAVPLLIDRIKTSALPQDRRAAITALTEAAKVSPDKQALIGEHAIKIIYAVLEQDKDYDDTLKATLELLIAICGTLDPPSAAELPKVLGEAGEGISDQERLEVFESKSASAAATNVDFFLGLPNAVLLLLQLLENDDFYVKFGTIELLTAMAANSRQTLQMAILEAPQGVTRICDLLDDTHRHVRSNAVLLLSTLCEGSTEICKIVAYGGVLEKLFTLIETVSGRASDAAAGTSDNDEDEESVEAAIVVQDVLLAVRTLINGASSTRSFFRDTSCLPRLVNVVKGAAADSELQLEAADARSVGGGIKSAVGKQARKNLVVSMQCISGLVEQGDEEGMLLKNDMVSTKLFKVLCTLAFPSGSSLESTSGKVLEYFLQVRVAALKTLALLARGHEDFRKMFSSSSDFESHNHATPSAQLAALRSMFEDPSSAIRAAAYGAFRQSFVVDAGLDLPSSALMIAMTGSSGPAANSGEGRKTGHVRKSLLSSADPITSRNAIDFIAESLKSALIGYPGNSDAASLFYAASVFTWVVDRVQGARERLLDAYVSAGPLLPQIVRALARLEREKGPPEARIALFSLLCTWLHGSVSAVSAFLSSAMHLPLLVDVVNNSGSRGDVAEVHVRGLASVLLGICLQASDESGAESRDGEYLSRGRGGSVLIPREAIIDVIRNRIGVTVFTACLDDLRASKAFAIDVGEQDVWSLVNELLLAEDRAGFMSSDGRLGHDRWYELGVVSVVNDVYAAVGSKVLDLMSESSQRPLSSGSMGVPSIATNGHVGNSSDSAEEKALLADSARDEVLSSYKEFIRTQDESLNAARRQIDELSTALRETQMELDARSNTNSDANNGSNVEELRQQNEELATQKQALEALVEEKIADFSALSDAYAALEEDQAANSSMTAIKGNDVVNAELHTLRAQTRAVRDSLNFEATKNAELSRRLAIADNDRNVRDAEFAAVCHERDTLAANIEPDVAEALHWRTRAEIAEASLVPQKAMLDSLHESSSLIEKRLKDSERESSDATATVLSLKKRLGECERENETLRSTRKRELQVAREASGVANEEAQKEIHQLREQLEQMKETRLSAANARSQSEAEEEQRRFETLKSDYQTLLVSFDKLQSELLDTRSAVEQWQRKAEAMEAAKELEATENSRLSNVIRDLENGAELLKNELDSHADASSQTSLRVTELERQSAELDEMRQRAQEEAKNLREEVAARTEQSIRLSGQLYESEEAKTRAEEELQTLRAALAARTEELAEAREDNSTGLTNGKAVDAPESLLAKMSALEDELDATKDALADSRDRENLGQAQVRDREVAVERVADLEHKLAESRNHESQLAAELESVGVRLMSLDEAEASKRALTMQVVGLQKALDEATRKEPGGAQAVAVEKQVEELRAEGLEKDMLLNERNVSLATALDQLSAMERAKIDAEKQVAESEATISVLAAERDDLKRRCNEMKMDLSRAPREQVVDAEVVKTLKDRLSASEERGKVVSKELAALVNACRLSEVESGTLRADSETLRNQISGLSAELIMLRKEREDLILSQEVGSIVSSVALESVEMAASTRAAAMLDTVCRERDAAFAARDQFASRLNILKAEMAGLQVILRNSDDVSARCSQQAAQLTELTAELTDLRNAAEDEDNARAALRVAEAKLAILEEKRESMSLQQTSHASSSVQSVSATEKSSSVEAGTTESSATYHRAAELEDALRDAAKTVSATNLELIAAQALLVELSADKTAIRNELKMAQEQIQGLSARLSVRSRAEPDGSALSEVSDVDNSTRDMPPNPVMIDALEKAAENDLRAANAEAENLRTMLRRSAHEADSAVLYLAKINADIEKLEEKLGLSETALNTSRAAEEKLGADLAALRKTRESEKESHDQDMSKMHEKLDEARKVAAESIAGYEEKLSTEANGKEAERKKWMADAEEKEKVISSIMEECSRLRVEVELSAKRAEELSEQVTSLERSNDKYVASVRALEGTVSEVNKRLEETEARESSLKDSLYICREDLRVAKERFTKDRKQIEDEREAEVFEFEAEIERSSSALEEAERKLRDAETFAKHRIGVLEEKLNRETSTLALTRQTLESARRDTANERSAKTALQDKLDAAVENNKQQMAAITDERDCALALVESRTKERDENIDKLRNTQRTLEKTEEGLRDEIEQRSLLESENQDLMTAVESLESKSKRLRDDLTCAKREVESTKQQLAELDSLSQQQTREARKLREDVEEGEKEMKKLRSCRAAVEEERDSLRESLDNLEAAKERIEQDNHDLKTWVADLERQAMELQSAAENFEDVEQSLRDALETQREISEQNSNFADDLKKEKEVSAGLEAQLRSAIREKNVAEAARDASQRKAADLQARIRDIRDENVARFSHSESAIRAKSRRCTELETELAAAERKVAELASESDSLFGAKAELQERESDIRALRERAECAESKVEELQLQVQAVENEVADMRGSTTGDAYRNLEAEHNELLVCLADLELEYTSLKEEVGRE